MIAYYLAPWVSAFAIGGGRFSLTDPGGGRPVKLSRCLLYGQWNLTPNSSITINATRGDGSGKLVCFSRIDQDDATHLLISADSNIYRLPFSDITLDNQFQSLSLTQQTSLINRFELARLDSTWIAPTTSFREIVRYVLRVFIGAKEMGAGYPEMNLATLWSSLTIEQRDRIKTYLDTWNVTTADIKNDTSIRTVITKIGRIARRAVLMGPDIF